jgi:DNA-directed RNA polymerase subunit beta'
VVSFHSIRALRISLADPEQIRAWSSGEVTNAETLNYRTLKSEPGGLFCERIFGPTKNWTCACGKYHHPQYKGRVCEKCGVRVAPARVRRFRMGHIELVTPICHIWYARGAPSHIGLLLDLSSRELSQVISLTRYIVLDIDETARQREIQRIKAELATLVQLEERVHKATRLADAPLHLARTSSVTVQEASKVKEEEIACEMQDTIDIPGATLASCTNVYLNDADLEDRKRELRLVLDTLSSITGLSLLDIDQYRLLKIECGQIVRMGTGAEAIQHLLGALNLDRLARSLRRTMYTLEGPPRLKALKRLKLVEALRRSQIDPQRMILTVLPVLPPDLRPVLQLDGGRFASTDLNELYGRVIHRNNRLKHFLTIGAPELILNQEKQALQAACDALLDNQHSTRPLVGTQRRPLRSLTALLQGKQGRFRRNLLGKRVDYSGRSVISIGLDLKVHQCGLPKKIALELFKPFIIHKLLHYDIVQTARQAKRAVERRHPAVWDILDEVMRDRVVLLNRAPTLHRLSIQAFEPVLVEGSAIRLPPQVCSAFNADFDGDQMAVHLPLSSAAQQEARELMLSSRNLLSPASGEPSISISQEMVLGCFYLTQERPGKKGEGHIFTDANEAILAYHSGVIDLQARISVRVPYTTIFEQPTPVPPVPHTKGARLTTTAGRLLFNAALPRRLCFRNYAMTKDHLRSLLWECIKTYDMEKTAELADAIKRLGFSHATRAGISFAISDVSVPPQKPTILAQADAKIDELRNEWASGLITNEERYQQSIAIWNEATDRIAKLVQSVLDPFGSVATIASSGATKARLQQIRQLSGMRGLMASPSGAVIETPVRGNFLEGLNVAEYFLSSHGARKSMMDRSLNTAEAGYLTIRFVNAAQDVIVTEEDCGTTDGLLITEAESRQMGLADHRSRLIGRVLAETLPQAGLAAGSLLDEEAVERIMAASMGQVRIRSVLACQARRGICRLCYGWDLSQRALVRMGTAVGIIAAQSIGEPGTQLTMRTFHSGGIAGGQGDITQGIPRVEELFEIHTPKETAMISEAEGTIEVTKDEISGAHHVRVLVSANLASGVDATRIYTIPPGRTPLVSSGQTIHAGDPLTAGALNLQDLLRLQGREAVERYLLREAQRVYRTTGAYIQDKHFEIIIRQMLRYVCIEHPGDSDLLPEELVDRFRFLAVNAAVLAQGGAPAIARTVLLGLTRATLSAESWLATASFQQSSRVLAEAAIEARVDHLIGLKENVILGKRIPAGTGLLAPAQRPRPPAKTPARRGRPPGRKKQA